MPHGAHRVYVDYMEPVLQAIAGGRTTGSEKAPTIAQFWAAHAARKSDAARKRDAEARAAAGAGAPDTENLNYAANAADIAADRMAVLLSTVADDRLEGKASSRSEGADTRGEVESKSETEAADGSLDTGMIRVSDVVVDRAVATPGRGASIRHVDDQLSVLGLPDDITVCGPLDSIRA